MSGSGNIINGGLAPRLQTQSEVGVVTPEAITDDLLATMRRRISRKSRYTKTSLRKTGTLSRGTFASPIAAWPRDVGERHSVTDYDRHRHERDGTVESRSQELHHAGRTPAPARRAAVLARERTAGSDAGSRLGREQR